MSGIESMRNFFYTLPMPIDVSVDALFANQKANLVAPAGAQSYAFITTDAETVRFGAPGYRQIIVRLDKISYAIHDNGLVEIGLRV
jgi:hypothetical protein